MKYKKKYKIEIDCNFGSIFQKTVFEDALDVYLKAINDFYNNSHKKNKIIMIVNKKLGGVQ